VCVCVPVCPCVCVCVCFPVCVSLYVCLISPLARESDPTMYTLHMYLCTFYEPFMSILCAFYVSDRYAPFMCIYVHFMYRLCTFLTLPRHAHTLNLTSLGRS